jgi:hypothetical protein
MKKIVQILGVFVLFVAITAAGNRTYSNGSCSNSEAKIKAIDSLNTFFYASSKTSSINYTYKTSVKEVEVPLFKGEKYRMVFNRQDLPKNVEIEIYDKNRESDSRNLLYSSKTEGNGSSILSYEPKKAKNLYINYIIPPAQGSDETGCIVFVLGYQLTFVKNK